MRYAPNLVSADKHTDAITAAKKHVTDQFTRLGLLDLEKEKGKRLDITDHAVRLQLITLVFTYNRMFKPDRFEIISKPDHLLVVRK